MNLLLLNNNSIVTIRHLTNSAIPSVTLSDLKSNISADIALAGICLYRHVDYRFNCRKLSVAEQDPTLQCLHTRLFCRYATFSRRIDALEGLDGGLGRILRIPYTTDVINNEVSCRTCQPPVTCLIKTGRLRVFGHDGRADLSQVDSRALRAATSCLPVDYNAREVDQDEFGFAYD